MESTSTSLFFIFFHLALATSSLSNSNSFCLMLSFITTIFFIYLHKIVSCRKDISIQQDTYDLGLENLIGAPLSWFLWLSLWIYKGFIKGPGYLDSHLDLTLNLLCLSTYLSKLWLWHQMSFLITNNKYTYMK